MDGLLLSGAFHSYHEKKGGIIVARMLSVIFTLVKHAGVRGQSDLSEPSDRSIPVESEDDPCGSLHHSGLRFVLG